MRNIKLTLQYDGAAFHGYQQQPNGDTVEARLKDAIAQILSEQATVYGCSRTDAGVHANDFCCNFKTQSDRPCDKIMRGLNAVLPPQIAVTGCSQVHLMAHKTMPDPSVSNNRSIYYGGALYPPEDRYDITDADYVSAVRERLG